MKFFTEHGRQINTRNIEAVEQKQASTFVTEDCKVLELGARYGTVSCIIAKKVKPNCLVVVEPDERVWNTLENNMKLNNCSFHIVKGFISKNTLNLTNLDVCHGGYGTTAIPDASSKIPSFTLEEIQAKYDIQFDTLVADCEGFLEQFFDENPSFYDQIKMILFEKDYVNKCNYDKIKDELKKRNFVCLEAVNIQEVWKRQDAQ